MKQMPMMISAMSEGSNKGFTFIELFIVIVIIGILTAVSVPQFRKLHDNFALENFVKNLDYLSRYIQGSAISRGRVYCLNINQDEDGINFYTTYQEGSEFKEIEEKSGKLYECGVPQGITIDSIDPADAKTIFFFPDGSSDTITLTFKNKQEKTVSLIIQGISGEIKIQ